MMRNVYIMIRIVLIGIILQSTSLSCSKAQSGYSFPLMEVNTLYLRDVLREDRRQLNEYVYGEDMFVSYNTTDSLLEITYLSRRDFYSFIISNPILVNGICIDNGFVGVTGSSSQFFRDVDYEGIFSLDVKEKEIKPIMTDGLIDFNSPTDYVTSIYKYLNGRFLLVSRNIELP